MSFSSHRGLLFKSIMESDLIIIGEYDDKNKRKEHLAGHKLPPLPVLQSDVIECRDDAQTLAYS